MTRRHYPDRLANGPITKQLPTPCRLSRREGRRVDVRSAHPEAGRTANGTGAAMTYCLGILLRGGLVLASDSRSNAGVDQVTRVRKLALLPAAAGCSVAILSSGNLATT